MCVSVCVCVCVCVCARMHSSVQRHTDAGVGPLKLHIPCLFTAAKQCGSLVTLVLLVLVSTPVYAVRTHMCAVSTHVCTVLYVPIAVFSVF